MTVPGLDYLDRVKPRPAPKNTLAVRAVSHKPTAAMRAEARRGLEWRRQHGRGGTAVGVARARDIANGRNLPLDTVKRMVSYFARHEIDKQGEGWSPGEDGYPSAGRIAWALWGGDAGRSWANSIVDAAEERYNPDQPRDENGRWASTGATRMDVSNTDSAMRDLRSSLEAEALAAAEAEPWLYSGGKRIAGQDGILKQYTAVELDKRMQDVSTDALVASKGSGESRAAMLIARGETDPHTIAEAVKPGYGDRLRDMPMNEYGTPVILDQLTPVVYSTRGGFGVGLSDGAGNIYDIYDSAIHGKSDGMMRTIKRSVLDERELSDRVFATEQIDRVVRTDAVSYHVRQWAESSNDHNPASLHAQMVAEREFELDRVAGWDIDNDIQAAIRERAGALYPVQSSMLRAMYNRTQEQLSKEGITELSLIRGMGLRSGEADSLIGSSSITMRPMSSWSTKVGIAEEFGLGQAGEFTDPNAKAVRVIARVPAAQVLSMPGTGYGCHGEYEVVLLGGEMGATIAEIPMDNE